MTTIAIDLMGSDAEPSVLVEGAMAALAKDPDLSVLFVGAEDVLPEANNDPRIQKLASTQVIAMDEHPVEAVRTKKDASIVVAAKAVKEGKADGLFSAGSTGAVLTAATFGIGRIKGIKRPALAVAMPGPEGHKTVFLDLGANADLRPEMLVQLAHMGRAYAEVVLGVENPSVGLLCNGVEETKGSELALAYHKALSEADCGFAGNAESTNILLGGFDVIVADGFSGNIALKAIEGAAKFIVAQLKAATKKSPRAAVGALLLKPTLKDVAALLSGDSYGGAILLGLDAPVIKGHGSTSAEAAKNGLLAAAEAVRGNLVGRVAAACTLSA